ncbi:DUF2079 domain-containing protein [Candidatus Omnitrophota bacterium]
MRHFSLSSGASDLGIFDQAIWNTTQGNILFSSLKGNINLFGDHFEPILFFIVPLYFIWSDVVVLLVLQSILLASAVIPLYLIAKYRLKERLLIFAFIISFILSKPLRGIGLSDFHPECFILLLLFWAYYFLIRKRNVLLLLSIFFLLLCKEDVTFLVSGLGIFVLFFQRRLKLGLFLFILGISLWILETKAVIPYFSPLGHYPYMDRLPFGSTCVGNIKAVINNPSLLPGLIIDKAKIEYCVKLFGPLGFLSFLSPAHYVLIAIPLLKNLLPSNLTFSGYYNISSHYTASIIPFIYISAIYGAGWLVDRIDKRKVLFVGIFIILSSLLFYGKTDGHKFSRFLEGIKNNQSFQRLPYLQLVPKNVSLATNFNLVPHMSQRKYIFEWNPRSKTRYITEYIVVDMNLLEYLTKEDKDSMGLYFADINKIGYKIIFSNPDKTFLIFHNPYIDNTLVEKVGLITRSKE